MRPGSTAFRSTELRRNDVKRTAIQRRISEAHLPRHGHRCCASQPRSSHRVRPGPKTCGRCPSGPWTNRRRWPRSKRPSRSIVARALSLRPGAAGFRRVSGKRTLRPFRRSSASRSSRTVRPLPTRRSALRPRPATSLGTSWTSGWAVAVSRKRDNCRPLTSASSIPVAGCPAPRAPFMAAVETSVRTCC